jgi:hypothetical protein
MNPERMRVLELLEQGKISAAEAAELLRALGDEDEPGGRRGEERRGDQPRWFRVRVTDTATGRPRANVSIPWGVVNFGMRFAPGNLPFRRKGTPRQVDELFEALRTGRRGTIYDVTDGKDGERIEIIVE